MKLHPGSHIDHVSKNIVEHVLGLFCLKGNFFIETIQLPPELGYVDCALYGPLMGDEEIGEDEVYYASRKGRGNKSRLINKPSRPTMTLTIIAGPYNEHPCVLFTVFGGPVTPKKPGDITIKSETERLESEVFWSKHALGRTPDHLEHDRS